MIDKNNFKKVFENVYSVKKLSHLGYEIEKKVLSTLKPQNPPKTYLSKSKTRQKDSFAPINSFITTTLSSLNASKLYRHKILPSQFLSTSKNVIKKLTRRIYTKPKPIEFPLYLPDSIPHKSTSKKKLNKTYKDDLSNISYANLSTTCKNFLSDNQKSRKMIKIKNRILKKKILDAKRVITSVERSNERAGYYLFHNKLQQGHAYLKKMDLIRPKAHDNVNT